MTPQRAAGKGRNRGRLIRHQDFHSKYVEDRNVDVWLPPEYEAQEGPCRVVYLHDGQNLFEPELAFAGVDWGLCETLSELVVDGDIAPTVAVGIWNTPKRLLRYMPKRPFELSESRHEREIFVEAYGSAPASDTYVDFIVSELKPFVEERYNVSTRLEDTVMMGASMGALVSLYALCEYPTVFGAAGCLSTSWTIAGDIFMPYLRRHLPGPGRHRFYFDYGKEARIERYEEYQQSANEIAESMGYRSEIDWVVRTFPQHDHSERAWRERVSIPLAYLLSPT